MITSPFYRDKVGVRGTLFGFLSRHNCDGMIFPWSGDRRLQSLFFLPPPTDPNTVLAVIYIAAWKDIRAGRSPNPYVEKRGEEGKEGFCSAREGGSRGGRGCMDKDGGRGAAAGVEFALSTCMTSTFIPMWPAHCSQLVLERASSLIFLPWPDSLLLIRFPIGFATPISYSSSCFLFIIWTSSP